MLLKISWHTQNVIIVAENIVNTLRCLRAAILDFTRSILILFCWSFLLKMLFDASSQDEELLCRASSF
jgi:hypothetical protein